LRSGMSPNITNAVPNATIHVPKTRKADIGFSGKTGRLAAERAVVEIARVTLCEVTPGVIVAEGVKEAFAPMGSGERLNVTGLVNVPLEDDTVNEKLAVCPAVTGADELVVVTA
jgi:hypothetical protein